MSININYKNKNKLKPNFLKKCKNIYDVIIKNACTTLMIEFYCRIELKTFELLEEEGGIVVSKLGAELAHIR